MWHVCQFFTLVYAMVLNCLLLDNKLLNDEMILRSAVSVWLNIDMKTYAFQSCNLHNL